MSVMIFKQISFDSTKLEPGTITLFADNDAAEGRQHDRISQRPEQSLVNGLMGEPAVRELLFAELRRAPTAYFRTEVQWPFYTASEGDIDLLVCDTGSPDKAAVLECKRVKIYAEDEKNDSVNKIAELKEGARQAKKLYEKFSFFQTYFTVISAIDAENQKQFNIPNRGVTPDSVPNWDTSTTTHARIRNFPGRDDLPEEIGIIFIEIVRPSSKPFEEQWTVRVCVDRQATLRQQSPTDTRKIEELMGKASGNRAQ